jgi:hypothetical protein
MGDWALVDGMDDLCVVDAAQGRVVSTVSAMTEVADGVPLIAAWSDYI